MQATLTIDPEAASPNPSTRGLTAGNVLSTTSIEEGDDNPADDDKDGAPPVFLPIQNPSLCLPKEVQPTQPVAAIATPSTKDFGGAHPRVPNAFVGSGHHKKAMPHHSTRT